MSPFPPPPVSPVIQSMSDLAEFQAALTALSQQVRSVCRVDRVMIYEFAEDGSGKVVAEAVDDSQLPSLLHLHFPAEDIPQYARTQFEAVRQRVIVDVAAQRRVVYSFRGKDIESDPQDPRYAAVDSCHVQYLLALGVMSSVTLPIFYQRRLWGLLVLHHSQARHYTETELQTLDLLAEQASMAVAQAKLVAKAQQHTHQESVLQRVQLLLDTADNLDDIWAQLLAETVTALAADSGRLYIAPPWSDQADAVLYTIGALQPQELVEATDIWQQWVSPNAAGSAPLPTSPSTVSHDVIGVVKKPLTTTMATLTADPSLAPLARTFADTEIQSLLVVPLQYRHQCVGFLSYFRQANMQEVQWAGVLSSDPRNQRPQQSFHTWSEQHQTIPDWSSSQCFLALHLGQHIYTALIRRQFDNLTHHQSAHDVLTQLPNWLFFQQRLTLTLLQIIHAGSMAAVVILNLSRFKAINGSLGHGQGDVLLQAVASRLRSHLQAKSGPRQLSRAFLARWHGDGFGLLVPDLESAETVHATAQSLLEIFEAPFHLGTREVYLAACIGIALAPYDGDTAEALISHAEIALHQAKQRGQQSYEIYTAAMSENGLGGLALEAELHRALHDESFSLMYQPQVNLTTGQIVGIEALLRWQHPQFGVITPGQFIPIAEETGLVLPLGEWVLEHACQQYQHWQRLGLPALDLSVNLSARQFQDPALIEKIQRILQATEVSPDRLILEITEYTVVADMNHTMGILRQLRALGVRIAIDDFGKGYSSLGALKHFPIDVLKIDREFVQDLETNSSDAAICTAIVAIAQGLNLEVLAEGVETPLQLQFLQRIHCDLAQGYLLSRPLTAAALTKLLKRPHGLGLIDGGPRDGDDASDVPWDYSLPTWLPQPSTVDQSLAMTRQSLAQDILRYGQLQQELWQQRRREKIVVDITNRIRSSLDVDDILNNTVQEIRQFLQVDRVLLYRFNPDWSGQVVVEAARDPSLSIMAAFIDDPCFRQTEADRYRQGHSSLIENVPAADISACHKAMLANYGVMANLVMPVVHHDVLWGLLIAHHCQAPRQWHDYDISMVRELADQAAIAIHQGELYSQLKAVNRQLQHLSSTDELTGLANRRRFDQYLADAWNRCRRNQTPLALVLADVDDFKAYNDTYGHQAGDACLRQVAQALQEAAKRPDDLVARYGGEEFAVILPNTPLLGAMRVAQDIQSRLRQRQLPHQGSVGEIVSLGLGVAAVVPAAELTWSQLIQAADEALYQAKGQGCDRIELGTLTAFKGSCSLPDDSEA